METPCISTVKVLWVRRLVFALISFPSFYSLFPRPMGLNPSYKGIVTFHFFIIIFICLFIYFHVLIEFKTNSYALGEHYGSARNFEDMEQPYIHYKLQRTFFHNNRNILVKHCEKHNPKSWASL